MSVFYSPVSAKPDIFAVMNCCIVALSVFSSDIVTWSADSSYSVQWHMRVHVKEYACILCQQTSPKHWFGNMNITTYCDVTNSPYQIQITTICHWMNPPHENFLRTPLGRRTIVVNPSKSHSKYFCKASDSESICLAEKELSIHISQQRVFLFDEIPSN